MMFFKSLKMFFVATGVALVGVSTSLVQVSAQAEVAVAPPAYLQLEITSACTGEGAVFKVINRGGKWPQRGYLRLYHADTKSLIGERRLRLAAGQKVSFVVKNKVMNGAPVAVWIEPEWYQREMEYDASIKCN